MLLYITPKKLMIINYTGCLFLVLTLLIALALILEDTVQKSHQIKSAHGF